MLKECLPTTVSLLPFFSKFEVFLWQHLLSMNVAILTLDTRTLGVARMVLSQSSVHWDWPLTLMSSCYRKPSWNSLSFPPPTAARWRYCAALFIWESSRCVFKTFIFAVASFLCQCEKKNYFRSIFIIDSCYITECKAKAKASAKYWLRLTNTLPKGRR